MQAIRRSFLSLANDPALKVLLEEDKDVIKAVNSLSNEILETSKFTKEYGETQHFDLKDILEHFGSFSLEIGKALKDMSVAYDSYREKLKEVRKMQDALNDLEAKSKSAAEKFKKAKGNGRPYDMLEREAEEAHAECLKYAAAFEGAKRSLIKDAMLIQYQGWYEIGQKLQTISTFGKHLAEQIPQGSVGPGEELPPYVGSIVTKQIANDMSIEMEGLKNSSLYRNSKKSSISSLRENSMKDLRVENGRKTSLFAAAIPSRNNSPLPPKSESPQMSTLLLSTPGSYVSSTPLPSQTVYLQGALPIAPQSTTKNQYQQSSRPLPQSSFIVQPINGPDFIQSSFGAVQMNQQPYEPTADHQIFSAAPIQTSPVGLRVAEGSGYQKYPEQNSNKTSVPIARLDAPNYLPLENELIACAFCLCGINSEDMNKHLDSNCRLYVAKTN